MKYKAFISYSHAADGLLAPAIQSALHQLARPWYKPRAIRVFRDETDLSASPNLWEGVLKALSRSEYFLLMASPEATKSKWVRREVDFWLTNRDPKKLLISLTDGEIVWDDNHRDFDWEKTTALPGLMKGKFKAEPLYADFRRARASEDVSLENPAFKSTIAIVASTLRQMTVADMIGEEVRQFRRTRRARNGAILALLLLLGLASGLAFFLDRQVKQTTFQLRQAQAARLAGEVDAELLKDDPTVALALAMEAVRWSDGEISAPVDSALCRAFYDSVLGQRAWYLKSKRLTSYVRHAVPSVDGLGYFTISNDGFVRRHDWSGDELFAIQQDDLTTEIVLSPDGSRFVTFSDGSDLTLYDARTGRVILNRSDDWTRSAVFDGEGSRLLIADGDVVELLDDGGEVIASYEGDDWNIEAAFFDEGTVRTLTASYQDDQRTFAIRDFAGEILVSFGQVEEERFRVLSESARLVMTTIDESEVATRILLRSFEGKLFASLMVPSLNYELSLHFSRDGEHLIARTPDHRVWIWSLEDNPPDGDWNPRIVGQHSEDIRSVFLLDDDRVLTASDDGTAAVWDAKGDLEWIFNGHDGAVTSAISDAEGRRVVTTSADESVKLWDLEAQQRLTVLSGLKGYAIQAEISPVSRHYLTIDERRVDLWDASGQRLKSISDHSSYADAVFSPSGDRFLTGPFENSVKLWDLEGKELATLGGHSSFVHSMEFSPDGTQILTASGEGLVQLWTNDGVLEKAFQSEKEDLGGVVFAPAGNSILMTFGDGQASLRDLAGAELATLKGHTEAIWDSTFSTDGQRIATASDDDTAKIWSIDGTLLANLVGHDDDVNKVEFVEGSHRVLTVASDYSARLWDEQGNEITRIQGQGAELENATLAHDGSFIVSGTFRGEGNILRLSDPRDNEICTFEGHRDLVRSVAISADNQRILSLGYDELGYVWYPPRKIYKLLGTSPFYELSKEQLQRFGLDVRPPS